MKNLFKDLIRPYVPFFLKQLNKILKYKRLTISDIKPDVNDFYKNLASNLQYNIIFDAGTFVGDYPLKLKNLCNKQTVFHLFEPFKPSFEQLKIFVKLEKNFIINQTALFNEEKKQNLNIYGLPKTNSFFKLIHPDNDDLIKKEGKREVNCMTLDNYCLINNIPGIDLFHIDVNGSEKMVLLGAVNFLMQKKINTIEIDFIFNSPYTNVAMLDEIIEFLSSYGYHLKNIGSVNNIFYKSQVVKTEEAKLFFSKN